MRDASGGRADNTRRRATSGRIIMALFRAVWPAVAVGALVAVAGADRAALPSGMAAYVLFVAVQLSVPAWRRRP